MEGDLASCLAEASREKNCDFVVMGSRDIGWANRAIIGSASDRVIVLCQCPVVVVKKRRDDAGAFLRVLPRRVFVKV
jgi:nucleotide-binding universal stress UspA family protein